MPYPQAIWCNTRCFWVHSVLFLGSVDEELPIQVSLLTLWNSKSKIKSLHIEQYMLYLSRRVKVVDHWLYLTTISLGPTPVSRTAKTLGTPQCMERVRPTHTWSPSRFCTQSVLLWGVDTCKMICQYRTLIESFLFLKNVPSMQPEDSSRILPSAIHGGYMLTL